MPCRCHGVDLSDSDPQRPFLTARARSAGVGWRELGGPAYRQIFRGVHIAAQLGVPSWPRSSDVHLAFSRSVKTIGDGIRTHRFRYRMERWHRHGLPVTGPSMTFIHLAVRMDLVQLVCFGDRLVARAVMSPDELLAAAEAWEGHGRRAAIAAARLVRARSESIPETQSRLLMVFAGLPEPTCNHPYVVGGVERFRLDLAWVEHKVALEYDGRWHDEPEQREKDERRRAEMRAEGWIIIVIRAPELYDRPDTVVDEVVTALRSRGAEVRSCLSYQRWFQPRGQVA